jgi:hypothetical protein
MLKTHCIRCGRKLKTPESQELGFGKICWEKWNSGSNIKPLFTLEDMNVKKDNK